MDYSVRVSPRARRMSLRVSRWGRVEVVVPRRHSANGVARFVAEQRAWIRETLADFTREYGAAPEPRLPVRLALRATGETWTVQYRSHAGGAASVRETPGRLVVAGDRLSLETCVPLLRAWLQRHARRELVPWLDAISAETGLRHERVQVRAQRTRWGSCSAAGTISINCALLFLPPRLVRYLFVHELCHLEVLNHSPRYWSRVAAHCPDWRRDDRALHDAWRLVPGCFEY